MKKSLLCLLVLLLATSLLMPTAWAYSDLSEPYSSIAMGDYSYSPDYDYSAPESGGAAVCDFADILTDQEEEALTARIAELSEKHKFDIVIHTTNSIGDKNIRDYADDFFDYNGYGYGVDRDGFVVVVNMNNGEEGNRDWYISTSGSGKTAFTDYAIDTSYGAINSEVLPYLQESDWNGAFNKLLDLSDVYLEQAEKGEPYDVNNTYRSLKGFLTSELYLVILAAVVGFVVASYLKKGMKTNEIKTQASEYVVPGSLAVVQSHERFTGRNIAKTPKPKQNSSGTRSGGGSSTHTSSSGSSHGGGGMKF